MGDIAVKTLGILIDELITADMKTWFSQEHLMDLTLTESERLEWAVKTQEYNSKRNQLIRAIDTRLGDLDTTYTDKTYTKNFENKEGE